MSLKPAIKINGTIHTGRASDSHDTLAGTKGFKDVPEEAKGFSDGRLFLTRRQAVKWVRLNQPVIFKKLLPHLRDEGLFSLDYANALGIQQVKPETQKQESLPDVSKKKALIYGYGYDTYMADRLAREYGEVFYYRADWRGFFPTKDKQKVGHGFESYERILNFYDYKDKVDIIIFFALYDADHQESLRKEGHTVYGSGRSEGTEIDKWLFAHILMSGTGQEDKELLKQYGLEGIAVNLPIIPTSKIVGLDNLKEYLKGRKDLYIAPRYTRDRGDMETEHFEDEEKFKTVLRELSYEIEYEELTKEFLVKPKVESSCESGYDEYQIDGQSSPYLTIGNEYKDETYICMVVKLEDLPAPLEHIRSSMAQVYKRLGYRGHHSTEVRFDLKGTALFTDDTDRVPQPPGEIWSELWKEVGANIFQVAEGKIPTMHPVAKYAAQINLHSPWLKNNWVPVSYSKEVAQWTKLRNNTMIGDKEYCLPFDKETTLGAIIGLGDTAEGAVKKCLEHLEEFWGHKVNTNKQFFDETIKAMQAGANYGINL
jgi:hypothetical protein